MIYLDFSYFGLLENPNATNHVIKKRSCGRLEHSPSSLDVDERVHKHLNGVLVTSHHQVGKADIVAGGDDARGHSGDEQLLVDVQLDVLHGIDGQVVVAEERVEPEKAHQAEVAEHLVEGALRKQVVLQLQK